MDINEYLEQKCNLLYHAQYVKYDNIFREWQDILGKKYHIKTVEIYSSEIFPRHILFNGEQLYINDKHFWNMYEHYLMAYFLCSKKLDIGMDYETLLMMIHNMILLSMANLLDNHPYLALSFAQEYKKCGAAMGDYNGSFLNTGKIPDIDNLVLFSFLTVFAHEIGHSIYNSPENESDKKLFTNFIDTVSSLSVHDELMNHIQQEVKKILLTDDKASLEEMFCDFLAENTLADVAYRIFKEEPIDNEILTLITGAVVYPITFQAFLLQNKLYWELLYYRFNHMDIEYRKTENKIEKTYAELTARGSFQTFLNQVFWSWKCNAPIQNINIKKVHEFDMISQELLGNSFFTFNILEREQLNRRKYSVYQARKLKNEILRWNIPFGGRAESNKAYAPYPALTTRKGRKDT